MNSHDYKRDGARTIKRVRRGPLAGWVEESAAYHHDRSAHYGIDAWTRPDGLTLTLSLGPWSASLFISR